MALERGCVEMGKGPDTPIITTIEATRQRSSWLLFVFIFSDRIPPCLYPDALPGLYLYSAYRINAEEKKMTAGHADCRPTITAGFRRCALEELLGQLDAMG